MKEEINYSYYQLSDFKLKSGVFMTPSQVTFYTHEILKRYYLSGASEKRLKNEFSILKPSFIKYVLYTLDKHPTISGRYLELNRIKFEKKFKEERSK